MVEYSAPPKTWLEGAPVRIASFVGGVDATPLNADRATVASFGDEWTKFSAFDEDELRRAGDQYFDIVPDHPGGTALDIGCGTGRWSRYLSPRVDFIEAVDPSEAVFAAAALTASCGNVRVTHAGFGCLPFAPGTFDFVFSLGVVHHLPDTAGAIREAASMVKPGGFLLLYIYYSLDGRGWAYRWLFSASTLVRRVVSRLPRVLRFVVCDTLAVVVYLPFVGLARLARAIAPGSQAWRRLPLSYYVDKTWRIIRNDALDRFGTPLEKRFSREQIAGMLQAAGLRNIRFSEHAPFWHVISQK